MSPNLLWKQTSPSPSPQPSSPDSPAVHSCPSCQLPCSALPLPLVRGSNVDLSCISKMFNSVFKMACNTHTQSADCLHMLKLWLFTFTATKSIGMVSQIICTVVLSCFPGYLSYQFELEESFFVFFNFLL